MPGYDTNRFVDLSPNEKVELTCSICQDILQCPVVTGCCLQSFCEDCISDWLKQNSICPYDRKTLTTDQLSRAPRALTNLLGKLRIRCEFCDIGYQKVIDLENLSNHLKQCEHNKKNVTNECEKCFCVNRRADHNCFEYLLDTNTKMAIELNESKLSNKKQVELNTKITTGLRRTYEKMIKNVHTSHGASRSATIDAHYSQEIEDLRKDRNNILQTIVELLNIDQLSSDPYINCYASKFSPALLQNKIPTHSGSILGENFKDITVHVKKVDMSLEMRDNAIKITRQALQKYNINK